MYFASHAPRTALLASAFVACAAAVAIPSDYEFHRQVPRQAGYSTSFTICRDPDFKDCTSIPILGQDCTQAPPGFSKTASSAKAEPGFQCFAFAQSDCKGAFIGPIPSSGTYRNLADNGFDNQLVAGRCFRVT